MLRSHVVGAGVAMMMRRSAEHDGLDKGAVMSFWSTMVILADIVVFLPVFLFISYSLFTLYPTVAMVEDSHPPIYERISVNEDPEAVPGGIQKTGKPVTSSLRATANLFRSVGGWRGNFRGLTCALVMSLAQGLLIGIFLTVLPSYCSIFGSLLATVALVQLNTAWVHIVITPSSSDPFWLRLPAFRRTFNATILPVLTVWAAETCVHGLHFLLLKAFNLNPWSGSNGPSSSALARVMTAVVIISIAEMVLVVPARVVLTRVQASLLPPDADAIVTLDRTFGGAAEPQIVGGKGYINMRAALATFGREAWVRLYALYAKIALILYVCYALSLGVILFVTQASVTWTDALPN